MGIKTVMITGDNPLTAAAIAAEAGVDDFLAQATPENKLKLIRDYQAGGRLVAMTGDGTNDAPALAQADVAVAMNTGTQAAKEAGNMVDLDSNPTKLIEIVRIGKQMLMTRGSLTTFSIANDVAKYFAIIPAAFAVTYPQLGLLNVMGLHSPESAILSAVIFNALVIVALIPLALRGVAYRPLGAAAVLRRNLLVYGVGGILVPFAGIKAHRPVPGGRPPGLRQPMSMLRPALVTVAALTLITGLAYPLAITGVGGLLFPRQAQGSLIVQPWPGAGQPPHRPAHRGSRATSGAASRPPATSPPTPTTPAGSNLAPSNPDLAKAAAGPRQGPARRWTRTTRRRSRGPGDRLRQRAGPPHHPRRRRVPGRAGWPRRGACPRPRCASWCARASSRPVPGPAGRTPGERAGAQPVPGRRQPMTMIWFLPIGLRDRPGRNPDLPQGPPLRQEQPGRAGLVAAPGAGLDADALLDRGPVHRPGLNCRGTGRHPVALPSQALPARLDSQRLLTALGAVALATLAGLLIFRFLDLADVAMLYVLCITVVATRCGRWAAVTASVLSVACLDYFFIPPRYTFAVQDIRHVGTFAVMLGVGWVVADLAERIRTQTRQALDREQHTNALYRLGAALGEGGDAEAVQARAEAHIRQTLGTPALVLLADRNGQLRPRPEAELALQPDELGLAQWSMDQRDPAGHGTAKVPGARCLFLPLVAEETPVGVLALGPGPDAPRSGSRPDGLTLALASQVTLALARARLAEERAEARRRADHEQLRSTLLSSVSHDLRTPLGTITGATTLAPGPRARSQPRRPAHAAPEPSTRNPAAWSSW